MQIKVATEKGLVENLDIDPSTPAGLYQLMNATSLASARIRAGNALQGARALNDQGWTTPDKMLDTTWEERVKVLNRNGYARYDESRARFLEHNAKLVKEKYHGNLHNLLSAAGNDPVKIREAVQEFKGIGPKGAQIFSRELRKADLLKKAEGPLFGSKPEFENDAKHNTYKLNYKGKNVANVYHKLRTKEHPSGVYIEPNYDNKDLAIRMLMRLIVANPKLLRDLSVESAGKVNPSGLHKALEQLHVLKK